MAIPVTSPMGKLSDSEATIGRLKLALDPISSESHKVANPIQQANLQLVLATPLLGGSQR